MINIFFTFNIYLYYPGRDVPAAGAAAERQRVRLRSLQNLHQVLGQRRGESCIHALYS